MCQETFELPNLQFRGVKLIHGAEQFYGYIPTAKAESNYVDKGGVHEEIHKNLHQFVHAVAHVGIGAKL